MKKNIYFVMIVFMLFLFVSCGKPELTEQSSNKNTGSVSADGGESSNEALDPYVNEFTKVYGQDPIAIIVGDYISEDKKSTATVEEVSVDEMRVKIVTGGSQNRTEWVMSGELSDDIIITFDNAVMTDITVDNKGEITKQEVKYTDGSGTVTYDKDAVIFTWRDIKSKQGAVKFVLDKK